MNETKTEKLAEKPTPKPTHASGDPTLIPVREIKFRQGIVVDIPGKNAVGGLRTSGENAGGAHWKIFYDPRLRHHRIEHFRPGAWEPEVVLVPESWVSWTPA